MALLFSDAWGAGRVEREFAEAGLECCTRGNGLGFRCGYVALPGGHPLFGKDVGEVHAALDGLDANGDLTFAGPLSGRWVLGWDAGHLWNAPDPGLLSGCLRERYEEAPWELHWGEPGAHMVGPDEAESVTRSLARRLASLREVSPGA